MEIRVTLQPFDFTITFNKFEKKDEITMVNADRKLKRLWEHAIKGSV